MQSFVLVTTHRFSGRAYMGASHQVVGPFASKDQAGAWAQEIKDSARGVLVRVSQMMPQVQVWPDVLTLLEPTIKPEAVLAKLYLNRQIAGATQLAQQQSGTFVLASVTSWNGRRYAGSKYALIGPFASEAEAQQWGKRFEKLPPGGPPRSRPTTLQHELLPAQLVKEVTEPARLVRDLLSPQAHVSDVPK